MRNRQHNHIITSTQAQSIVQNIISKMMYTCDNPYCHHRLSASRRTNYNQIDYNRFQNQHKRISRSKSRSADKKYGDNRKICLCLSRSRQNPQDNYYQQNNKINNITNSNRKQCGYTRLCRNHIHTAGDYQREQYRGRWVNNSLHNGYSMKKILYQSQNPRARIQSGPFAKNYDKQYQIAQSKIMNTRTPSPQGHAKIATLVRRDRERSKSK